MRFKLRKKPINVKLTETEMLEPYSHLFYRSPAKIPNYVLDSISRSPYSEKDALLFENINDLLNPGYLPLENGYAYFSDGSLFVAVLTKMPSITGEMIDWWFWWNPQNPLRYKIMYPQAHFGTGLGIDIQTFLKKSGTYHKRLWNTTTYPVEDIGAGKNHFTMHFVPPEKFGFDTSQFKNANVATVICGITGSVKNKLKQHAFMCQFVRRINNGVEIRSRCWIGHTILVNGIKEQSILNQLVNKKIIKKRIISREIGQTYCMHCAQEYSNLAEILPELYSTYA